MLDLAVLASDSDMRDGSDWTERKDEISKDVFYLLQEVRSLRHQLSEIQRTVDVRSDQALTPRWVELNDNGLFLPKMDGDTWSEGEFVEIQVQIPSLHTPEILAGGEVIRVSEEGAAISFRCISAAHSKAILQYALRRERQLARSQRFS